MTFVCFFSDYHTEVYLQDILLQCTSTATAITFDKQHYVTQNATFIVILITPSMTMQFISRSYADLSPQRLGFIPTLVYVESVVDEAAHFLRVLWFSLCQYYSTSVR